jgi:protoporphyrinogen oxidase
VVIGGGLAGLAAAYDLARAGQRVTVMEAAPEFGGLASSFSVEGHTVERFYHFVCRSDQPLVQLIEELGLGAQLSWQHTRTAFYYEDQLYAFGTPFDLLKFRPIPLVQRVLFGVHILRSYYRSGWRELDRVPARDWLIKNVGAEAYQVIWHPLLRVKFGEFYDQISAAWMWHRIWRVAKSRRWLLDREVFGWLAGGSATLVDELIRRLREFPNVDLRLNTCLRSIQLSQGQVTEVCTDTERLPCRAVISTVALPVLEQFLARGAAPSLASASPIRYIGVVCMLLSLKRPLSPYFWLNTNDRRISFNGIIEMTNLRGDLRAAGLNLVYVPYYLATTEPRYTAPDAALYAEYVAALKLLNPAFDETWIKEWQIFRNPYAQAMCVTRFADLVPPLRASTRGLYVTDSTQFYPEDRTLSAAVQQGRRAAQAVLEDNPQR